MQFVYTFNFLCYTNSERESKMKTYKEYKLKNGKTLIDVAEKSNFEQVELCVVSKNDRAIKKYESFGFEKFGIMPRAIKYEDGTYMDMLSMVRFLQKE